MKHLKQYISDRVNYTMAKLLLPESTVKTFDYLIDIFKSIVKHTKVNDVKKQFDEILNKIKSCEYKTTYDLIVSRELLPLKDILGNVNFVAPVYDSWDIYDIKNKDLYYVIPYGNEPFSIIPLVIHNKSLYYMGTTYRGHTHIKSDEDIYKYLVQPAENAIIKKI